MRPSDIALKQGKPSTQAFFGVSYAVSYAEGTKLLWLKRNHVFRKGLFLPLEHYIPRGFRWKHVLQLFLLELHRRSTKQQNHRRLMSGVAPSSSFRGRPTSRNALIGVLVCSLYADVTAAPDTVLQQYSAVFIIALKMLEQENIAAGDVGSAAAAAVDKAAVH